MKKIIALFLATFIGFVTFGVTVPALLFGGLLFGASFIKTPSGMTLASLITTSATWTGKQNLDFFIKPLFTGNNIFTQAGVRIIPNVQSTLKLGYFGSFEKVLKAYSKGFSAASGDTYTQRDLTVSRMKGEFSQDAMEFYQTVWETALNKGVDWNNIKGTQLQSIIVGLFRDAVERDLFRQFWLGDVNKETLTSLTYSGTADVNYNAYNGIWKFVFDNAATSPSSVQIKRFAFSHGAVAQVDTATMTGTSGTCNITFNGTPYLATFNTSLTITNTDFVTAYAAILLLRGVVVTASVADLIFTSSIPGQPFDAVAISAAVTGDLTGSRAATTPNTAPSALATDEALAMFKNMFDNSPRVLKAIKKNKKVFLVSDDVYSNYYDTLDTLGTEQANKKLEDGVEKLTYRGVEIQSMSWGEYLDADFPTGYPSRIIYTAIDNLVLGIDAKSEFNKSEFWYNQDEQENRYRIQLKIGAQYVHNELMSVAY